MTVKRLPVVKYATYALALALIAWGVVHVTQISGLRYAQPMWNEDGIRLTFVCKDPLSEDKIASYWVSVIEGMRKAAEHYGVSVNCVSLSDAGTDEGMRLLYRSAASSKVNGIICVGTDTAPLAEEIDRAWGDGIPTVCLDGDVPGSRRIAYFGTDNHAMGEQAGRIILDRVSGKGAVYVVLMHSITNQFRQRIDGMVATVETVDGMRVVTNGGWDEGRNQFQIMYEVRQALKEHPDIVAIYSPGSVGIVYAAQEVEKAYGQGSEIALVSIDDYSSILECIRQGTVTATIAQKPYDMGYRAVEYFAGYLQNGGKAGNIMYTDTIVVDRTNVEDYMNG